MTDDSTTDAVQSEIVKKNPTGRPLKFKTVYALQRAIDDYFENTPPEQYTVTGLALALDTSRKILMEYEQREIFRNTIQKAKTRIENSYELALRKNGRSGDIFALKNFGWSDQQQIDVSGSVESVVIYRPAKLNDGDV